MSPGGLAESVRTTRSGTASRDVVPGPPKLLYYNRLTRCVTAREGAYHRYYLWRFCLRRSRSAAPSGNRHPDGTIRHERLDRVLILERR